MVEPGALETCHTEQPSEASKLVRTRAQRIPSRSRASAHTKTGYICADQTVFSTFRLRQGGGPYNPYCRYTPGTRRLPVPEFSMSALAMMCSLSVSAVQGDFRWPFVCWLELDGRSDSQTEREVCETTVNSAIVAQGIHTKRKGS
jgi:hypothetical protein